MRKKVHAVDARWAPTNWSNTVESLCGKLVAYKDARGDWVRLYPNPEEWGAVDCKACLRIKRTRLAKVWLWGGYLPKNGEEI